MCTSPLSKEQDITLNSKKRKPESALEACKTPKLFANELRQPIIGSPTFDTNLVRTCPSCNIQGHSNSLSLLCPNNKKKIQGRNISPLIQVNYFLLDSKIKH